ncbi:Uncharacterised protein [Raoultella terrigena]|uniref:N-acetyltransferase domain-containing protein n=1 Tax=Raoultella terrigena TaxID=577 RepID=A0A485BKS9_RAOTE|nr:Uncharacterised protein [Raoultella terrigena]
MVINIRELQPQDKLQWLGLWEGYTCFYGSPQPDDVTQYTWQRLLDGASPVIGRAAVVDGRGGWLRYLRPSRRNMGENARLLSGRPVR